MKMETRHNKQFKQGDTPWNKGVAVRLNDALDRWRENGGEPWNKGVVGESNPLFGIKRTEETIQKMRVASAKRMDGKRKGEIGTNDGHGHLKVKCSCKDCGLEMLRRTDSFKDWSGRCVGCAKKYRRDNARGSQVKRVQVSCSDCGKFWVRKLYKDKKWLGRCHSCCHKYKHSTTEQKERCRLNLKKQRELNPEKYVVKPKYGEEHWNWQGGKTPENAKIRQSLEYKQWRTSVFKRDDYTCQLCGQRGGKLHADHIKPFAEYPELRIELSNGRALCVPCHKKTETYGFRKKPQRKLKEIVNL